MSKQAKTTSKTTQQQAKATPRADVYTRVTDRIVADLEQGVRTWMKPWSTDHALARLPSLPLRHCGSA